MRRWALPANGVRLQRVAHRQMLRSSTLDDASILPQFGRDTRQCHGRSLGALPTVPPLVQRERQQHARNDEHRFDHDARNPALPARFHAHTPRTHGVTILPRPQSHPRDAITLRRHIRGSPPTCFRTCKRRPRSVRQKGSRVPVHESDMQPLPWAWDLYTILCPRTTPVSP